MKKLLIFSLLVISVKVNADTCNYVRYDDRFIVRNITVKSIDYDVISKIGDNSEGNIIIYDNNGKVIVDPKSELLKKSLNLCLGVDPVYIK